MNMDYSKAFELLSQDAEKERNKKAEKVVRDNLYNKGFRDGLAVIDKIRAEIEHDYEQDKIAREVFRDEKKAVRAEQCTGSISAYRNVLGIIDKALGRK